MNRSETRKEHTSMKKLESRQKTLKNLKRQVKRNNTNSVSGNNNCFVNTSGSSN